MHQKIICIFLVGLLTITTFSYSQGIYYSDYNFRFLTMADGLSNYKVNAICKDNSGFMWFGTNEGLNRYDGYNFKVFKHSANNEHSISNNLIRKIIKLRDGVLCVATDKGVDLYNHKSEDFMHVKFSNDVNGFGGIIWALVEDSRGSLWTGSIEGLFYKQKKDTVLRNFSKKHAWFKNYEVTELFEDLNHNLWIGTKEQGIFVYSLAKNEYSHFVNDPKNPQSLNQNWVEAIYQDKEHNIWIGTNDNGLNLFNPADSSFTTILIPGIADNKTRVRDMQEDKDGRLWIAAYTGLYLKKPGSNNLVLYASMNKIYSKLLNNSLYDIYIDNTDMLWLGTFAGGVNYCDLNQKKFRHFEYGKNDNQYLNDRIVYAVVEDKDNNLWVGTERGGINQYNPKTGLFTYYTMENTSMKINNIRALLCDYKNNLWVGTYKGLYYFDTKTKTTVSYFNDPKNPQSISSDIIYNFATDHNNNLWIGTRNGVDFLPVEGKEFVHYPNKKKIKDGFPKDVVHSILVDSKDNIWIGTALYGLYKYSVKEDGFVLYSNKIEPQAIHTICEDSKGNIWFGGNNGIYCISKKDNKIYHYRDEDGLQTNTIFRIIDDKENNLWISTTTGLTKFVDGVNTPGIANFVNYDSQDGLFVKQFTNNSYYKSKSGELFFGGVDGFVSFYPNQIKANAYLPLVQLTNLKVFNKPVSINEQIAGKVILDKSISASDKIVLTYKHNVFTIEFAGLHFANPSNIKYASMLEGFDKDWNYTDNDRRSATYTNLSSGTYTFKVKASNNDGAWNETFKTLQIKILPPFWKTTWFYSSVVIFIFLIILIIFRIQTRNLFLQNQLLEQKVNERTQEVTEANVQLEERQEEIEMQNEELAAHRQNLEILIEERTQELKLAKLKAEESDKLKSAFLANMSHEIRTPMNAIVGFSRLLCTEEDKQERQIFSQIISNNSDSLLVVINDILDVSLIESNQLKMQEDIVDPKPIFIELEAIFRLKDTKNLHITFESKDFIPVCIKADSVRFRQVISNLLENAIKYTEKGYVYFGYFIENEKIVFYVKDSGIGIHSEDFDRIFNYFEKLGDDVHKIYRGTGIGLSLCKKLIELMNGRIWLESEEGIGSSFFLSLPAADLIDTSEIKVNDISTDTGLTIQILVAEDEETNYKLLEKYLSLLNLPILFYAKNGKEMVDFIKENPLLPNTVILMDIKMPVLNGIDALNEIRKINKDIPVIAVTAYATELEKQNILKHNFDAYLSKPLFKEELQATIEKVYRKYLFLK